MTFTSHGHPIPDSLPTNVLPLHVARCGGPGLCQTCSKDVSAYHRDQGYYASTPPKSRHALDVVAESVNPAKLIAVEQPPAEEVGFEKELERLINRHSLEGDSGTPDYILATYLTGCLNIFNETIKHRAAWRGEKVIAPKFEDLLRDTIPLSAVNNDAEKISTAADDFDWAGLAAKSWHPTNSAKQGKSVTPRHLK